MSKVSDSNVFECANTYVEELARIKQLPEEQLREYAVQLLGYHAKAYLDESSSGGYLWDGQVGMDEEEVSETSSRADEMRAAQRRQQEWWIDEELDRRYQCEVDAVSAALEKRLKASHGLQKNVGQALPLDRASLKAMEWEDFRKLVDSQSGTDGLRPIVDELLYRLGAGQMDVTQYVRDLGLIVGVRT